MGFRLRQRFPIGKFARINLSRSGASPGLGPRGANINIGPRGVRKTIGIPGTGVSFVETSSAKSSGAGTNRVIWILAGLGALTWFGSQVVQRPAIAPSAAQTPPSVAGTRSTQVAARAGTPATERPDAVYLAGLAALDRGDYQQALRLLSTAIEVDPGDVWAYLKRAAAYEQTGDSEKAIADYRSVLAIDRSAQMKRYVEGRLSAISPAER
jgi:Protein of unknown function (DUF4236)/Tetratricopeptide repeat